MKFRSQFRTKSTRFLVPLFSNSLCSFLFDCPTAVKGLIARLEKGLVNNIKIVDIEALDKITNRDHRRAIEFFSRLRKKTRTPLFSSSWFSCFSFSLSLTLSLLNTLSPSFFRSAPRSPFLSFPQYSLLRGM